MPTWCRKRAAPGDPAGASGSAEVHSGSAVKRARCSGPPEVEQDLQNVQLELQLLDERCADEQIETQKRYDRLRRPHFARRGVLLKKLPGFWKAALCGHPSRLVHPAELEALEHITDLEVSE